MKPTPMGLLFCTFSYSGLHVSAEGYSSCHQANGRGKSGHIDMQKKTATHTHLLLFPCPFKPFSKRSPLSTFNCYLALVCQIVVVFQFQRTSVLLFLLTMQEFKTMLYLHVCRSKTEKFVVFLSNFVLFMTSTSPIRLVYL